MVLAAGPMLSRVKLFQAQILSTLSESKWSNQISPALKSLESLAGQAPLCGLRRPDGGHTGDPPVTTKLCTGTPLGLSGWINLTHPKPLV